MMLTDPRPEHVLKIAAEISVRLLVRRRRANISFIKRRASRQEVQEYPTAVFTVMLPGAYVQARWFSRWFIGVYRAWLAADANELPANRSVQLNARRRWRGKKHVPDSQNRGAVTRRCCGARRPIDHQSLPSRMRRSLPHDFGAPTPLRTRVPSYIPSSSPLQGSVLSLLSLLSLLMLSPFLILFPPIESPSCLSRSVILRRAESTRQLPCLLGNVAPDEASRPGPVRHIVYLGGATPTCPWLVALVAFVDSGDKPQSRRAA